MRILFGLLFFSLFASAQTHQLTLDLATGSQDYLGKKVYVGYWLDTTGDFPESDTFEVGAVQTIESTQLKITKNLTAATYAVSFFIDMNDNEKLDTNFFGVPKEPYGFSNNFKPKFSAPDFEDCSFVLSEDTTLQLNIID